MSTVTPKINLTKPAGIEQFSLALFNGNMDKIDENVPTITKENSTFNSSDADFRTSDFVRLSVGTQGLVYARIAGLFKNGYGFTMPSNTSSLIAFNSGLIPDGFHPKAQIGAQTGPVISNENRGDSLQGLVSTDGIFSVRSNGGSFTFESNGALVIRWAVVWEWNGVS